MKKKIVLISVILWFFAAQAFCATYSEYTSLPDIPCIVPIEKNDSVLILAPHPDDETIACAGVIQQVKLKGAKVHVVYITNGDHNQLAFIVYEKRLTLLKGEFLHMGDVRRQEAEAAMGILGLKNSDLTFLGYPDFGTLAMFMGHWGDTKPFRSLLTRVTSVPYKANFSFGAPYKGESVVSDLKAVIRQYKPNKIFVSSPADTNGDHRAAYLFLEIALSDLALEKFPEPTVYSYLIHCVNWPLPRHYHPGLSLHPPKELNSQIKWMQNVLDMQQVDAKHRAILAYKSQTESSAFYLLAFARRNEMFGDYPDIDLKFPQAQAEPEFVGSSSMYEGSELGVIEELDSALEGKGSVSYAVSGDSLLVKIDRNKPINRRFGFMVYLFGYNDKTPFGNMPKVRIAAKYKKFKVFDAKKMIKPEGVSMAFSPKSIILKVPLKVMGDPDFVLTSMKTYSGILPLDTTCFRKIKIRRHL